MATRRSVCGARRSTQVPNMTLNCLLIAAVFASSCRAPAPSAEDSGIGWKMISLDLAWESEGRDAQFAVTDRAAIASWTEGWYPIPAPGPEQSLAKTASAPGRTRFHLPVGWSAVSNGKPLGAHVEGETSIEDWL